MPYNLHGESRPPRAKCAAGSGVRADLAEKDQRAQAELVHAGHQGTRC